MTQCGTKKLNKINRHDLLFLSEKGLQLAHENAVLAPNSHKGLFNSFENVPAIYKTQSGTAKLTWLEVGFSYPTLSDNIRQRIASQIPPSEILKIVTPWEAIEKSSHIKEPFADFLNLLKLNAVKANVSIGMYGSAALEAVTGLNYLHKNSDIDIIIKAKDVSALKSFYSLVVQAEKEFNIYTDIEVNLNNRWYVKLKELLSQQETVVAKGEYGPKLIYRQAVLNDIQQEI